jgi:hypothetical protein
VSVNSPGTQTDARGRTTVPGKDGWTTVLDENGNVAGQIGPHGEEYFTGLVLGPDDPRWNQPSNGGQSSADGQQTGGKQMEIDPAATKNAIAELAQIMVAYEALMSQLQTTRANPTDFAVLGIPAATGQAAKYAELVRHGLALYQSFEGMHEALTKAVETYEKQDESVADIMTAAQKKFLENERKARRSGFVARTTEA